MTSRGDPPVALVLRDNLATTRLEKMNVILA
jgi:hypothetical protein